MHTIAANSRSACLGLLCACGLFNGCETAPSTWTTSGSATTQTNQSTYMPAPGTTIPSTATSSANKSAESITFVGSEPTITVVPPSSNRSTQFIGLYGELNDSISNAGSPLDGAGNLLQCTFATDGACLDPDIDITGTWMAFASTMHRRTADIYMKQVNGKTQTQLTTDPSDDVMPAFSSDSKTIAFASNRGGNWDIYTITADGGRTVQITNDSDHELHPTWSPDGRTIAYCKFGSQSQRWEIWTVDSTNPGVRNFLDYGLFPQWQPGPSSSSGNSKILFQRSKQRGSREYSIWTIDVVNGQAKFPTEIISAANAALINPAWSPDGQKIVFVSVVDPSESSTQTDGRPSQSDLWVVNLDGTERTMLTNGQFANFQPVWSANGTVYFVSDRAGTDNVWAATTRYASPTSPAPTMTVGADVNGKTTTTESHP